jgi:glycosyltransferase involved in cell wall biosynthesis
MKIALVVPGGVDRSGEYRVIPAFVALIKRLAERHEVHVFAFKQETSRANWRLEGAFIHNIGGRLTQLRCVAAIVKEHRRRPFDIVQSIFSGSCGFVAVCVGKLLGLPRIVHVAGGELAAIDDIGFGGALSSLGRLRERWILRNSVVTAASMPILDQIAKLGLSAQRVPLGVDRGEWTPQPPQRRSPNERLRLIHVASINRVKDHTTLLHAIKKVADSGVMLHLDVVGEDTLSGRIQALADTLGLGESISFLGFQTQRQLRPLMAAAHINLVSSRHEAGPLVVLEAACMGVPTIGTSVGHIIEWTPHAALAVPVGDAKQLAAAVERLHVDEDLRLGIAVEAQRRSLAEDADFTARTFEHLYASLIASRTEYSV